MQMNKHMTRGVALLTAGVLAASALFHPTPAAAVEKSKAYKAGAVVLGAASAYMILKGKTVPGVAAGAGAYYAYKKSKDAKNDEYARRDRYPDDYYAEYPDDDYYDDYGYSLAPRTRSNAKSNLRTNARRVLK